MNGTEIELSREVEAIQIPKGDPITLPTGTKVIITQSLGGTYTVATEHGLARIGNEDADALGLGSDGKESKSDTAESSNVPAGVTDLDKAVWDQLKNVYDPEIPVNIVDLGLVYGCEIMKEGSEQVVEVKMTLTAPGCGMGPTIAADAQGRIMTIDGIDDARVELVWDPPWNQEMISEEGKMHLGMI